jgi:hypothetical protein
MSKHWASSADEHSSKQGYTQMEKQRGGQAGISTSPSMAGPSVYCRITVSTFETCLPLTDKSGQREAAMTQQGGKEES